MESNFDKKQNLKERLEFVRFYSRWVKSVPNEVWSKQQTDFLDSLFENSVNYPFSPEKYLKSLKKIHEIRFLK